MATKPRKPKKQLNEEKARRALESALQELSKCEGLIAGKLNDPKLSAKQRNELKLLRTWIERAISLLDLEKYYDRVRTVSVGLILKATAYVLAVGANIATIRHEFTQSAQVIQQQCVLIESIAPMSVDLEQQPVQIHGTDSGTGTDEASGPNVIKPGPPQVIRGQTAQLNLEAVSGKITRGNPPARTNAKAGVAEATGTVLEPAISTAEGTVAPPSTPRRPRTQLPQPRRGSQTGVPLPTSESDIDATATLGVGVGASANVTDRRVIADVSGSLGTSDPVPRRSTERH